MYLTYLSTALRKPIAVIAQLGLTVVAFVAYVQIVEAQSAKTHSVVAIGQSNVDQTLASNAASKNAAILTLGTSPLHSLRAVQPLQAGTKEFLNARSAIQSSVAATATSTRRFFVTDLGSLGGTESFAYAINFFGQTVGSSRTAGDAATHSFLYRHGNMTDLAPLNSGDFQTVGPTSINDIGQVASGVVSNGVYVPAITDSTTGSLHLIGTLGGATSFGLNGVAASVNLLGHAAGYSYINSDTRHAFLYRNGTMKDLGSFGGDSFAFAVNDFDVVVGSAIDAAAGGAERAFRYANGVMTPIGPATESNARDVNFLGQVVGEYFSPDQSAFRGFLYSNGKFTDFGTGPDTTAFAINNLGLIVGSYLKPFESTCDDMPCIDFKQHAFLLENKNVVDLNDLVPSNTGLELQWAFDVNDLGQIVGYGQVNDKFRAYLLTPAISTLQCKNKGWQVYGFKNQGQCVRFVNHN